MAIDRHVGRGSPVFTIEGHPDKFIALINAHGMPARIQKGKKCPCVLNTGSPDIYCEFCRGAGFVYYFQRRLLQTDEDSDCSGDGQEIYPFRVPILEPVRVERLLPPEQGGIAEYTITGFDELKIKIAHPNNDFPKNWQKKRVTYWFDRFTRVEGEAAQYDPATHSLILATPRWDDGHRSSNPIGATGDIVSVEQVFDYAIGMRYHPIKYSRNRIYLRPGDPAPISAIVDYHYCPIAKCSPQDLENRLSAEKWQHEIPSGLTRIAFEPWFDLSDGDLITLLIPTFSRSEIMQAGDAFLSELDVWKLADEILDSRGGIYRLGVDYVLRNEREIQWIGNRPGDGAQYSVQYSYHPTYTVFMDGTIPNNTEAKQFVTIANVKLRNNLSGTGAVA